MELVEFGRLIGHDSRVQIMLALMGGKALPAGELAYRAGVTCQTATSHLNDLQSSGMIKKRKCGRFNYFEIASKEIASTIENLAVNLPTAKTKNSKYSIEPHIKKARFCYDHLAGELSIAISEKLIEIGALSLKTDAYSIPVSGHPIYEQIGIDLDIVNSRRRKTSPRCVDWSERLPHVAGSLGFSIANQFINQKYIERSRNDRSVHITKKGLKFFREVLFLKNEVLINH